MLIIATAILFAWLLVSVTRVTLGELHIPRLHPSPAPPPAPEAGPETTSAVSVAEPVAAQPVDDADAERAVREHLYGRRERRA